MLQTNYVHLLRELKEALEAEGMMLTISVSPTKRIIDEAYDIPGIAQYADLVTVTTYDLHGPWEHHTNHHSGLYAFSEDTGCDLFLNVVSEPGSVLVLSNVGSIMNNK